MGDFPPVWQEKDHYHFRVAWLQPHPDYLALDTGSVRLVDAEEAQREGLEPTFELDVHPGWWIRINVHSGWEDSLEESLNAVKSVLKNSEFGAGVLELRRRGERAPERVSKSQRRALIGQIMHLRDNPRADSDDGIVREAFLRIGEHALWVWIEHAPFREEFETAFGAPESPLRSLVGKVCALHGLSMDDYEKEERPWRELARGPLELEGTTVRVGGWSHTFRGDEEVFGVAFEEASLESAALQMSLSFNALDSADTPLTPRRREMSELWRQRELPKQYDPFAVEDRWVRRWAEEPFTADAGSDKPPFCIVIPPPNVTGNLHLGHAFDNTLIDTLVRFKRMNGFEALFQPGTDHAGISTQVQVERALRAEGKTRQDLGREAFLERMWAWKEEYGGIILSQLQRLGISADWSRTRSTLDEGLSKAVRKQFVELYHRGLVYRGERIVNWDPESQTTLSDLEVDREDRPGKLYTLAYELEGGGALQIATVRPETIFADVAVAVHPEDERFAHLHGKKARIPLTDRWVPVITDEAVEPDFGTGALKITPAHDPTDFEIGLRHGLPRPSVIGLDAKLTGEGVPEAFRGLDRFDAREKVVAALQEAGALLEAQDYTVPVGLSERTKAPVEPILSTQWFFKMDAVAPQVLAGLDAGEMRLTPERYLKVNRDWLLHLRDWNISRQLWWGHRIPAWYDPDGNVVVPDPASPDLDPPDDPRYAGVTLTQDPDVFDTWFSSNLWPFSTLGWPDESDPFFRKFYPTSVLVTGYDILFFWVTKMQLAAYALLDEKPFTDIVLHGLVLDEHGQKMSKSKGNGVDPLSVIGTFGADALRFAMAYTSTGGQDIRWDERRVEMGRNFNNKLWNAARFAMMNFGENVPKADPVTPETLADRWILSRLQRAVGDVTRHLDAYDLGAASRTAYDFVWSEFCDWYLEAAKPQLRAGDAATTAVLAKTLTDILKLLHPLVPFITSELYEALGHGERLGWASWPRADASLIDADAERDFARLQHAVTGVRNLRAEANVPPSQEVSVSASGAGARTLLAHQAVFRSLTRATLLETLPAGASLSQVVPELELRLPLEGLVDIAEWRARQEKRLKDLQAGRDKSAKKLANAKFVENAPTEVVGEEKRRLAEAEELIAGLEASLAQLA